MNPIIIDCDPGIDDVMALLLALSTKDLEIRGITTLAGNVSAENTARNALAVCELCGRMDIPVCAGAEESLDGQVSPASDVHGRNGIGDVSLPVSGSISGLGSVAFLIENLDESDGDLEIVALGPLTNLALLLEQAPESFGKIRKLTIMGGSLGRGNVTQHAEFNFYADPLAADRVLHSGIPIDLIGLDVTNDALMYSSQIDELAALGGSVLSKTVAIIRHYMKFYQSMGFEGLLLHDPLAMACVIEPKLCSWESHGLKVDTDGETRGRLLIDPQGKQNCRLAVQHNHQAFMGLFMESMARWKGRGHSAN